jgi:hypothetical protein
MWIDVDKKLPELRQQVLCFGIRHYSGSGAIEHDFEVGWVTKMHGKMIWITQKIIPLFWMPLPAAPTA